MTDAPIFKSYGTLLRNVPLVNTEYQKIASKGGLHGGENWKSPIELPLEFDGRVRWKNYISTIKTQGTCGSCWAIASADSLGDRFALFTFNQVKASLSACALTICDYPDIRDVQDYHNAFKDLQTAAGKHDYSLANAACFGNSLINAAKFLTFQGIPYRKCCGEGPAHLREAVDASLDGKGLPFCEKLQGLKHVHCSDPHEAMQVFRARTFGVVAGCPEDGGSEEYLKFTLYKYGSFPTGFSVFEDFLKSYDGKSVYVHDPQPGEKTSGGHAIRVVGWGGGPGTSEPIPYWICANSWGPQWGDNGYFKFKRGSCDLEKNAVVVLPALNYYDVKSSETAQVLLSPAEQAIRDSYVLDKTTKYPVEALKMIKRGQLRGDLHPVINYDYVLENVRNPIDGTWYAGRDVPETPPNIPQLAAVHIATLLRNNGINPAWLQPWWVWLIIVLLLVSSAIILTRT